MTAYRTHILVELDDVLANGSHRKGEDIPDRVAFLMRGDKVIHPSSRMVRGFERSGVEIVIVGPERGKEFEKQTKDWLRTVGIPFDYLVLAKGDSITGQLRAMEREDLEESVLLGVIAKSQSIIQYGLGHPHKPTVYEIKT